MSQPQRQSLDCDIAVQIKKDLLRGIPLPHLQSRCVTATIFAFYGTKAQVCQAFQVLSHKSRAFIVTQNGLNGFLKKFEIVAWLRQQDNLGQLYSVAGKQRIDFEELEDELSEMRTPAERKQHMELNYPGAFVAILKHLGNHEEVQQYMAQCKTLRDDPLQYSHYVHGCLGPWLQERRDAGELQIGYRMVLGNYYYYGETDCDGNACGEGVAINADDKSFKYRGTFINNLPEGVCKQRQNHQCCVSQVLKSTKMSAKVKASTEPVGGTARGPTKISSKLENSNFLIEYDLITAISD